MSALAWARIDRDRCPGCGQPRSESMAPANDDRYEVRTFACFSCEARHRRIAQMTPAERESLGYLYHATHLEDDHHGR